MRVRAREIPPISALSANLGSVYYYDSFEVGLSRAELDMRGIYLAIFAHHPKFFKLLLNMRNQIVPLFGLKGASVKSVNRPKIKDRYQVGDKILRFTLRLQNETEIIAGNDDKHLDFRVSVLRIDEGNGPKVVVTTTVTTHNPFGRAYLSAIKPFHRHGVKTLLANAARAQRI